MDGAETEVIDLTLDDDDDDLASTLPAKDEEDEAFDESVDVTLEYGLEHEPAEEDDDIYSLETLPASLSRMDTVLGFRGAAGGRLSRLAEETERGQDGQDDDEGEEGTRIATTHNGTQAGSSDVALPAQAALCPSPSSRNHRSKDAEPSVGADVPAEEPLFPWIEPFNVVRPKTFMYDKGQVTVWEIPGDGHCLYRSVLHQQRIPARRRALPSDHEVDELRAQVATHLRLHRDAYSQYFSDGDTLNESITTVEQGGWGDSMSLSAIANMWGCPIEVYMEMGVMIRHLPEDADDEDQDAVPALRLAYRCIVEDDGQLVYNHYDSVAKVVLDENFIRASPAPRSPSPPPRPAAPTTEEPSPSRSSASASTRSAAPSPLARRAQRKRRPCADPATASTPAAVPPPGAGDPAYRSSSQDLVDPASPSPALTPPGSPDDQCVSASQETLRAKQLGAMKAPAEDERGAKRSRLRLSQSSSSSGSSGSDLGKTRFALAPLPLLTSNDPNFAAVPEPQPSLEPPGPLDLGLLPDALDAAQKTSEWVSKVWDLDVDTIVAAFGSSPERSHDSEARSEGSDVTLPASPGREAVCVSDAQTNIVSVCVCDTVVRSHSDFSSSAPRQVPRKTSISSRTISTNVTFSNGKLIGTFQVFY